MTNKKPSNTNDTAADTQADDEIQYIDPDTGEINEEALRGMRRVDTEVDQYPSWDWGEGKALAGKVIKLKEVTVNRRSGPEQTRMAIVETTGGRFTFWETASLVTFFNELQPGSDIVVIHRGKEELSGGRDIHLFDAFIR